MKFSQLPHALMMVRPHSFAFNPETASTNVFQQAALESPGELQLKASKEFETMLEMLNAYDIEVVCFNDDGTVQRPDAVFPNNWVSFHEDGKVILYPMMAVSRRSERQQFIIEAIREKFAVESVIDLSPFEEQNKFLEGTGSMVFDHINKIIYASESPRTDRNLVNHIADLLGYRSIIFHAHDESGQAIYHTNVMMSIGRKFALICLDAIQDDDEQGNLLELLAETEKKVIAISYAQMKNFAGNVLEVQSRSGEPVLLISDRALRTLLPGQVNAITQFSEILSVKIDTIEQHGGGGVRCMVAGIHLPVINRK